MNDVIKRISVDGVEYDIVANGVTKTTHAELKTLRDNGELVPGQWYRITDYEFTTVQSNTKSAGHVFDILVLAMDEKTLNHNAFAAHREGDEYFAHVDIEAWKLMYDLDNDQGKYDWADAENGKGVIYRMIDEKRNDCPYDFKNALFYNDNELANAGTTEDGYYHTFSYVSGGVLYDGTVEARVKYCYGNSMGEYRSSGKLRLNDNVWRSSLLGNNCYSNTFGNNCYSNTFGNNCHFNTFGDICYSNTFGDYIEYRKIDSNKASITLNDEYYDDGSGQLVPVKHPDLSTQPSILPYKFMGQYVYEQLIPMDGLGALNDANEVIYQRLAVGEGIFVLHAEASIYKKVVGADENIVFGDISATLPVHLTTDNSLGYPVFKLETDTEGLVSSEGYSFDNPDRVYLRLIYTTAPSESGGYAYGGGAVDIPHSGFVFKIPQDYYVDDVRGEFGVVGEKIGSSDGYDYWHVSVSNVHSNSSLLFYIRRLESHVPELNAKVYKDGLTLIEDEDVWGEISIETINSYAIGMSLMPDATWVFIEIQ